MPQQRSIASVLTALRMYIISIRCFYLGYIGVLLHELRIEMVCIKPQNRISAQKRPFGR